MLNVQDLIIQAVNQSNLPTIDKLTIAVGMELRPAKRDEAIGFVLTMLIAHGMVDRETKDRANAFDIAKLIELLIVLLPILRDIFSGR